KRDQVNLNAWYLTHANRITIGKHRKHPFHIKGLISISAIIYGTSTKRAVQALAQGVAIRGGSLMNSGGGCISPYHISRVYEVIDSTKAPQDLFSQRIIKYIQDSAHVSNFELEERFGKSALNVVSPLVEKGVLKEKRADLIFQVGSGLFGARK